MPYRLRLLRIRQHLPQLDVIAVRISQHRSNHAIRAVPWRAALREALRLERANGRLDVVHPDAEVQVPNPLARAVRAFGATRQDLEERLPTGPQANDLQLAGWRVDPVRLPESLDVPIEAERNVDVPHPA